MALFDKNKPFIGVRIYDYFLEVWERLDLTPTNNDLSAVETTANAALPMSGGSANGAFTFNTGQTNTPITILKSVSGNSGLLIQKPNGGYYLIEVDNSTLNIDGLYLRSGSLSVNGNFSYHILSQTAKATPAAGYSGFYRTGDNLLTIWRNSAGGIEQKIAFPLTAFGTTKMSVTNTPTVGTLTGVVAMNVKTIDTGNEFNTATHRWTATIAGTYELNASVFKVASTETKVYFRKNGVAFGVGGSKPIATNAEIINVTTEIVSLQSGDYIDVFVTNGQIITDFPTNSFKVTAII